MLLSRAAASYSLVMREIAGSSPAMTKSKSGQIA
jgi:hypothetical protein